MNSHRKLSNVAAALVVALAAVVLGAALLHSGPDRSAQPNSQSLLAKSSASNAAPPEACVELAPSQLNAVKIEHVGSYQFPVEKGAFGNIDYDQDLSVQVFSPYQGKIITPLAELGDAIEKGEPLYTIESPDLIQAEATLIGAAASFALTTKELARAKDLYGTNGVSEREIEQATSDQQTAEGSLKAAKDAVRLFGKTEKEIESIASSRKIDPTLVVRSPISGRVTSRNAQPGLLVQPGSAPAPYAVSDLSTKWMVASVNESDSPLFQVGQSVQAEVMAFGKRIFEGKISKMGAAVDPNTHRVMVRCDIADPQDELRPGMLASFLIRVKAPVESMAIPMTGVVRNGDSTMAAWVTTDRQHFVQRLVTIGLQRDGRYQITKGLEPGELVVTDGAIFLSSLLQAPVTD